MRAVSLIVVLGLATVATWYWLPSVSNDLLTAARSVAPAIFGSSSDSSGQATAQATAPAGGLGSPEEARGGGAKGQRQSTAGLASASRSDPASVKSRRTQDLASNPGYSEQAASDDRTEDDEHVVACM